MDEMSRLLQKYVVNTVKQAKKANIKPVKIDFPLPTTIQGIDTRINTLNTYQLPLNYGQKNQP